MAALTRKIVQEGIGVAPGLAVGTAVFHDSAQFDIPLLAIDEEHVDDEYARLEHAIRTAREALHAVELSIEKEVGRADARIFSVQGLLLDDPSFAEGIRRRIREDLVNAECAVRDEVTEWERRFSQVPSGPDRDPGADLRDVGHQLQRVLSGRGNGPIAAADNVDGPIILVTHELLPSDAARIDRTRLAGLVSATGGVASHAAILARGLGIPAVTGVDVTALPARGGRWIVDGSAGRVIVNPTPQDLLRAAQQAEDYTAFRDALIEDTRGTTRTADGVLIELLLNVESFRELPERLLEGTAGIGLYRTEFLFMNRTSFPSEDEQLEEYVSVLKTVGDREVTFRTIDVGGDKPLSYFTVPHEPNPVLGWRGVRLTLEWPDLLYTQLRALLRASHHGRVRIMVPMITMIEEFRRTRAIFDQIREDLRRRKVAFDPHVPFGAMVEVPALALSAGALAAEADFLSIGTNDLAQYALAVDRNNARVSDLFQPLHPGILAIVRAVLAAGEKADTPVCLCGEMAGDPEAALVLLGLGLRSFSMSPYHLPVVRRLIKSVTLEDAVRIAHEVLEIGSTTEVRRMLRRHTLRVAPELASLLEPGY